MTLMIMTIMIFDRLPIVTFFNFLSIRVILFINIKILFIKIINSNMIINRNTTINNRIVNLSISDKVNDDLLQLSCQTQNNFCK